MIYIQYGCKYFTNNSWKCQTVNNSYVKTLLLLYEINITTVLYSC